MALRMPRSLGTLRTRRHGAEDAEIAGDVEDAKIAGDAEDAKTWR
jgi:hypothetical protein